MNEYRGIVPYLFYADVGEALAWYTRVFGFVYGPIGAFANPSLRRST